MDKTTSLHKALFSTPLWQVFNYLLQHSDKELIDAEISFAVRTSKKSAINIALRKLAEIGFITRYLRGRQAFNKLNDSPLITHFKIISNMIAIKELTDKMEPLCSKIILFGSRAEGTNGSESDFDIFVVTVHNEKVKQILIKHYLFERIQFIAKSPDEMLTLDHDLPIFQKQIKKGIVLWEKK